LPRTNRKEPKVTEHHSGGAALELRGISKHYGIGKDQRVAAASDISLGIAAGSFVAVTGASGSGKSTLLYLIGAIERPDAGAILSNGTEITRLGGAQLAAYRRSVGFVFQRYNLLPALTALDNVIAPVLPYRTRWNKRDRARELLAAVGLADASTPYHPECPVASSNGSRSPGRWSTAHRCCWPTNRPATSTRPTPPRSLPCSPGSASNTA
jgi:ABC-type ATPase involved in cell division